MEKYSTTAVPLSIKSMSGDLVIWWGKPWSLGRGADRVASHVQTVSDRQDGWMDPIGNQHLDLGNEQSPYRDGRRIPRR